MDEIIYEKLKTLEKKIGNTPLIDLGGGIFGKVEGFNPAGSVKDRTALYIIKRALENGLLDSGIIVEATSGNTGIGLAFVARELGLKCVLTMPESMSAERRQMLAGYGAELILTPASEGMAGAVNAAKQICMEKCAFFANQFANKSGIEAHFKTTAPEIFNGLTNVGYVVCGVGSGGTAMGIKKYIEENNIICKIAAVEPANSPMLSKGYAGTHKIQGIGANFVPELVDINKLDLILTVSDTDALESVKEIYNSTSLKCGISSGASYHAAKTLKYCCDKLHNCNIVVILPDNGDRYPDSLYI